MCTRAVALLVWLALAQAAWGGAAELIGNSSYADAVELVASQDGAPPNVLVLGSGGLVGSALAAELRRRGYNVLESRDRMHLDLRVQGSLSRFDDTPIAFCFFLACEVGGSKFIASGSNERAITRNNEKIYDNVFPYLQRRKIPFLFSSSQLSGEGMPLGEFSQRKGRAAEGQSKGKHGQMVGFQVSYLSLQPDSSCPMHKQE